MLACGWQTAQQWDLKCSTLQTECAQYHKLCFFMRGPTLKKNETWSYWQLLVVDNEQIRVGGLNVNCGGQLDSLICCLTWDKYTNEHSDRFSINFSISNTRKHVVIKADITTSITKFIIDYIYLKKCATPDPRFNLHKVVALIFNVFEDALDILAFCALAVLSVEKNLNKTLLRKEKQWHWIFFSIWVICKKKHAYSAVELLNLKGKIKVYCIAQQKYSINEHKKWFKNTKNKTYIA